MSDLQIALAAIGVLVVGGVYAFNLWQERKLRRRLQGAFAGERDDALLAARPAAPVEDAGEPRIEPRLDMAADATPAAGSGQPAPQGGADPLTEFVAEIEAASPVADAAVRELLSRVATFGKPARVFGCDEASGSWRVLDRGSHAGCRRLQAALQLANRSGPLHAPQLNGFCDAVREWATRHGATAGFGDTAAALESAHELDGFCGEMDVAIGVSVVAAQGAAFPLERVAAAAAAAGFRMEPDGLFHMTDAEGRTLFTLEDGEAGPLAAGSSGREQTSTLTLLLDVPRVADGAAVFDRMAGAAALLAENLRGVVADDNRRPLRAAGLAGIRQQLQDIQAAMAARDIAAGGSRAQRLFA